MSNVEYLTLRREDPKAEFFVGITVFAWVMVILQDLTFIFSFDKICSRSSPWTLTVRKRPINLYLSTRRTGWQKSSFDLGISGNKPQICYSQKQVHLYNFELCSWRFALILDFRRSPFVV